MTQVEKAAFASISSLPIDEAVTVVSIIRSGGFPHASVQVPGTRGRNYLEVVVGAALEQHPQWREFFRNELAQCAQVKTPREVLGDDEYRKYRNRQWTWDLVDKFDAAQGARREGRSEFGALVTVLSLVSSRDAVAIVAPYLFDPHQAEDEFPDFKGSLPLIASDGLREWGIDPKDGSLNAYREWWVQEAASYGAVAPAWPPPPVTLGASIKESGRVFVADSGDRWRAGKETVEEFLESERGPGVVVSLVVAAALGAVWWMRRKR